MLSALFINLLIQFAHSSSSEILITKFSGTHENFSLMHRFEKKGASFEKINESYIGEDEIFLSCKDGMSLDTKKWMENAKNIFAQSQLLALSKFIETGYLTKTEALTYLNNSFQFSDRTITFLHAISDETVSAINGFEADSTFTFNYEKLNGKRGWQSGKGISSSLYIVADFSFDKNFNKIQKDLPWMKDKEFLSFIPDLIRRPENLYFEIGRASGNGSRDFINLLYFTSLELLKQVNLIGKPQPIFYENSFVTFHALNNENKEKFKKLFNNAKILESKSDPNNCVFLIKLKDFIEKFDPKMVSETHKILHEFAPHLNALQKESFLNTLAFSQLRVLDFKYKNSIQNHPIVISTQHSIHPMSKMDSILQYFKISQNSWSNLKLKLNNKITGTYEKPLEGVIFEPNPQGFLMNDPRFDKSYHISNLNPDLVNSDPTYLVATLAGVFNHLIEINFTTQPSQNEVMEYLNFLSSQNVTVTMTTQFTSLSHQIKKLNLTKNFELSTLGNESNEIFWRELKKRHSKFERENHHKLFAHQLTIRDLIKIKQYSDLMHQQFRWDQPQFEPYGYFRKLLGDLDP